MQEHDILEDLRRVWTSEPSRMDLMHYCDLAGNEIEHLRKEIAEYAVKLEEGRRARHALTGED